MARTDTDAPPDQEQATDLEDGLQTGGTRGSSSQGGPERAGDPEKDNAVAVANQRDEGSRSSEGRDRAAAGNEPTPRPEAPEPLPPGAEPEDYVGGEKPHKTCSTGETQGASGVKNEVV